MKRKKVLVLDDDIDILDILTLILTDHEYDAITLVTGENILETINQVKPDLVLMDVMLGKMDGRVLCQQIKTDPVYRELPVILISASHDLSASLSQLGAPDDFIAKPFDIDNLIQTVKRVCA